MTSNITEGKFVFTIPSYFEGSLEDRIEKRKQNKLYHDNLYLSFKTLDNLLNYDCSRKFRSGWWFPYRIKYKYVETVNFITYSEWREECSYNGTNLNGYFDEDEKKNKRMIGFCMKNNIHDCVISQGWVGWEYKNMKCIKLRTTKIWLGRRYLKE